MSVSTDLASGLCQDSVLQLAEDQFLWYPGDGLPAACQRNAYALPTLHIHHHP